MDNKETNLSIMADRITKYLRIELQSHQNSLRNLQKNDNSAEIISFDELMPRYTELSNKAWDMSEGEEKDTVVKQLNYYASHYGGPLHNDKGKSGDRILLSDQNIEELLGFVKESILNSELDFNASQISSSNFFMRGVLNKLRDSLGDQNSEKFKKLENYIEYLSMNDYVGKDKGYPNLMFTTGYGDTIKITYDNEHNQETLFLMSKEGNIVIDKDNEKTPLEQREATLSSLENEQKQLQDLLSRQEESREEQ